MSMTIDDLIARLEELRDDHGGETEVRLMTQQNWPFENGIHGVCSTDEMRDSDCEDEDAEDAEDDGEPGEPIVYIVEGSQLGYGSKSAWNAC